MSFQVYRWRGEIIKDIRTWAKDRGERMVQYEETVRTPWGPEISHGEMPESFWSSLLWPANTSYKEIQ